MITRFIAEPFFMPVAEELRYLPEGPRVLRNYGDGGAKLGWVGIQNGAGVNEGSMNVLDLSSGANISWPLNGRPGFFAETAQKGVVLVGFEHELAFFDLRTGALGKTAARIDADADAIINDGLAVDGGVLFGTKDLEFKRPIAALYFLDFATGEVRTLLGGQTCSNGKFLRRDSSGATLIDIDTAPKRIGRYRLDSNLERVLETGLVKAPESLPAFPDGMRPAPDGDSVIVAFYNPGAVSDGLAQQIRLSDGAVLSEWIVPGSPRVTCPEFVTLDGKVKLLLTTAVEGMPAEIRAHAPGAGWLYIADTEFQELPAEPPLVPGRP
jgi:sugar lactone lactonase YvrE